MKPLRLAADTNLLLDLADKVENVLDTLALVSQRLPKAEKVVTPTVLDELAYLCDFGHTPRVQQTAQRAIRLLRDGVSFRPLLELPFPIETIEEIAEEIRVRRLLPAEEINDSLILAEVALADCGILLTSDAHLRSIDHEALTLVLRPFDLAAPVIATPRELVRKFFS